jgi:stearoyl-CoA desaturase (Delta-9 desaturase)
MAELIHRPHEVRRTVSPSTAAFAPESASTPASTPDPVKPGPRPSKRIDPVASIPFFLVHAVCLLAFYTGASWKLVLAAVGLYYFRMLGTTIAYHRYFSHRAFKTGRVFQFVLAFWATTSAQKGALWWAANHRHHHRESDSPNDLHSPVQDGFWWSHVGWILSNRYNETNYAAIKDFARYPELVFLNKHYLLPPLLLALALFAIGGLPLLVWGFFISTVMLWHGTFAINSLTHVFGKRRYRTTDTSRNNWLLALLTCGEGWHNNHHYHQNTANQGWFWWEVDFSYYLLKLFALVGLVSDLRTPSDEVRFAFRKYTPAQRAELRTQSRLGVARPARPTLPSWQAPVRL